MEIRRASNEDIPGIIALLKISLGESLMPKTEAFWRWKHIQNPFGESMVLLAEENGQIIGVRAFMNWEWNFGGKIYKAVRAVDTATHPDHQGKGIFKKLTLAGLEIVKSLGTVFVYNTPNQKSKPGYLKMGWREQGRMSLKIKLNPFAYKGKMPVNFSNWNNLLLNEGLFLQKCKGISTNCSKTFLDWRYAKNPMFNYHFITDHSGFFLVYRYKQHNFGIELRITDFLIDPANFNKQARKFLNKGLKKISNRVMLTSVSGNHYEMMREYFPTLSIIPVLSKGPIVTLRNVHLEPNAFDQLLDRKIWSYTLGDLELF